MIPDRDPWEDYGIDSDMAVAANSSFDVTGVDEVMCQNYRPGPDPGIYSDMDTAWIGAIKPSPQRDARPFPDAHTPDMA